jgi:hypothetical protein
VDPVSDPLLLRKSGSAGNRTRTKATEVLLLLVSTAKAAMHGVAFVQKGRTEVVGSGSGSFIFRREIDTTGYKTKH